MPINYMTVSINGRINCTEIKRYNPNSEWGKKDSDFFRKLENDGRVNILYDGNEEERAKEIKSYFVIPELSIRDNSRLFCITLAKILDNKS